MDDFQPHHLDDQPLNENDWISSPTVIRTDKTFTVKDFFVVDDQEMRMSRGQRIARKAISGNYTIAIIDYLVGITSLATTPNIGLPHPSVAAPGKTFIIKDEAGGAATTTITIASDGEKNIDGSSSTTLTSNYQVKRFYTDGANWFTF